MFVSIIVPFLISYLAGWTLFQKTSSVDSLSEIKLKYYISAHANSVDFEFEIPDELKITSGDDKEMESEQETVEESSLQIPDWVRGNAEWWAQDLISDDDFVKGIQYLIEQGIIKV